LNQLKAVAAFVLVFLGGVLIYFATTKEQRQRDSLIPPRSSPMSELAESHDPRNWDRILASAEGVEIQRTLEFEQMLEREIDEPIVLSADIEDPRFEYLKNGARMLFNELLFAFAGDPEAIHPEGDFAKAGYLDIHDFGDKVKVLSAHSPSLQWRKLVPPESRIIIGHAADIESEVGDRLGMMARGHYGKDFWYLIMEYRIAGLPGDHATHLISLVSESPGQLEWVGGVGIADGGLHFLGDPPANLRPSSP